DAQPAPPERTRGAGVRGGSLRGQRGEVGLRGSAIRDVPESMLRIVTTAGREAVRTTAHNGVVHMPSAAAFRTIARVLLGAAAIDEQAERACVEFANTPNGSARIAAMSQRALGSLVRDNDGEVVTVDSVARILAVNSLFSSALGGHDQIQGDAFDRVIRAAAATAQATTFELACQRAADAALEVSQLGSVALYVPDNEHARMTCVATASASSEAAIELPTHIRIDRDTFADALAAERPICAVRRESSLVPRPTDDATVVVAVPLRDDRHRPVGMLVCASGEVVHVDDATIDALARLASVIEGILATTAATRRSLDALETLPELADIAEGGPDDVAEQLDELASLVMRATGSDAAVIRVRDAAGRYLETPAAASQHGDAVSDVVGSRTWLAGDAPAAEVGDGSHEIMVDADVRSTWSSAGRRMFELLDPEMLASRPIASRHNRQGVLYVMRRTRRLFDEVDRACIGIIAAHAQHVIDRHVSSVQTERAITAARSAVRALGDALGAGVRPERTIRFLPRLFSEMFACTSCRIWRCDVSANATVTGEPVLVAGIGTPTASGPAPSVIDALLSPLQLKLATNRRPHVAAVSFEDHSGSRIVIEFELS
ncbi:MAG: hypothetical protein H7123_00495, partial [Thermoleophilia bacterium]|nr:hypothetical protein [Thermoleophilia bacterium]